ncbi:hypothetical protein MTO96_040792 [Rhipicephalus appendiculatus]
MHYLSTWDSVTSETVSRCFGKCGFRRQLASEDTERSEDDPCASDIDINEEFLSTGADAPCAEFVSIDDNVPTCKVSPRLSRRWWGATQRRRWGGRGAGRQWRERMRAPTG